MITLLKNKRFIIFVIALILAIACNAFIIIQSNIKVDISKAESDWVASTISDTVNIDFNADFASFIRKALGHFLLFAFNGMVTTLAILSYRNRKNDFIIKQPYLISGVFGFIIAILSEIIQHFTPGRFFAFKDIAVDTFGYLLGLLIIVIIVLIYKKRVNHKVNS